MKKIALIISAIFILVFLFGCGTEKAENVEEDMKNVNETEVELVTKEQIMEHFGISEEELEGIDVDAVIKEYKYTEEILEDDFYTKEFFLNCLKLYDEKIKTDIGYLFKGGQPDGEIPVSQIKTVAFSKGDYCGEYVIDDYWQILVPEKKAYYNFGYKDNMDLEKCAERSGAITDEYIADLLSCLEKANLHKWKAAYERIGGEMDESLSWHLGVELMDGTVYSWKGYDNSKPEEYQAVKDVIVKAA